jgi:hypothetical protein
LRKLSKFVWLFSLLLLFIVGFNLSQVVTVQASEQWKVVSRSDWQYATKVAPPGLMQKVVQENISESWLGDPGRMKIVKFQTPKQKTNFYLIDTQVQDKCPPSGCNSFADPLCGSAGCAYFIYVQEGNSYRKVLSEYFKNVLPPKVPFLRVSNQLVSGLPCLEFTELINLTSSNLKARKFCYNGKSFSLVGSETRSSN